MEAKVTIATVVSDVEQDEIDSTILRQKRINGLNQILLYQTVHTKNFIVLVSAPVKKTVIPNVVVPIQQKSLSDFEFMFDVTLLNVMPTSGASYFESFPTFVVKIKDSVLSQIIDINLPVSKNSLIEINTLMTSLNFITKYFSSLISSIPLVTQSQHKIDYKLLDLSKMGERNFSALFNKIKNVNQKHNALQKLEFLYVEGDVVDIPEYAAIDSKARHYSDDRRNYTKVTVPLFNIEADMIPLSHTLFRIQYCHPIELMDYYQKFQTKNFMIDSNFRTQVMQEMHYVRVPRVITQLIDIKMAYTIPRVVKDFITQVENMVAVMVKLDKLTDSVQSFKDIFRLNANTDSPWSRFSQNITEEGIVGAMKAMHFCGINRNLFILNISGLSLTAMNDAFIMASIFIAQTFLPADVIPFTVRMLINNSLAYYLYSCVLESNTLILFKNGVIASGYGHLLQDSNSWANAGIDLLAIMYRAIPTTTSVWVSLQAYFNNVSPSTIFRLIDDEPLSTWAPYMYGTRHGEYIVYSKADRLRMQCDIPKGGVIQMTHGSEASDLMVIYGRKMQAIRGFLTGKMSHNTPFTAEKNKMEVFLDYIAVTGRIRYEAFVRYYTYFQMWYSTSVCADAELRKIPYNFRKPLNFDIKDCLGLVLKIAPEVTLQETGKVFYLQGTDGLIGLTVFLTYYKVLKQIAGKYSDEKIEKTHLINLANQMTSHSLGVNDYNAEDEFQITYTDKAMFLQFLDGDVSNNSKSYFANEMLQIMNEAKLLMDRVRNTFGIVDTILLSKKSLNFNNGSDIKGGPIIASNSMPKNRIRVVKRYESIHQLRTDMTQIVFPDGARHNQYQTAFELAFDQLAEPSVDDLRKGVGFLEAIEIPIKAKINLELIVEDGKFKEKNPKFMRCAKVIEFVENIAKDASGAKLLELPIFMILNDIGNQEYVQFTNISRSMYTDTLDLGQVYVRQEQLNLHFFSVDQLLENFRSTVILKKHPFEIRSQMQVPFEMMDVNNPIN